MSIRSLKYHKWKKRKHEINDKTSNALDLISPKVGEKGGDKKVSKNGKNYEDFFLSSTINSNQNVLYLKQSLY